MEFGVLFFCRPQILELLVQRDREFQELMDVAQQQGKVHQEMQLLEKEVEKRDSDIQQLQKQLKEAEHLLVGGAAAGPGVTAQLLSDLTGYLIKHLHIMSHS